MGDRVGPVGTGESSSSLGASSGTQRLPAVNWSMVLDRQEALVSTDPWLRLVTFLDNICVFSEYLCR